MDLTIHTDNVRLTEDLEDFIQRKLSKLNRYLPNIKSVHVELVQQNSSRGPDVIVTQITLRHSRGAILRTEEKLDKQDYNSLKSAIVGASDKMYRRIRRFKGKRRSKRLRDRFSLTPEEMMEAEPLPDEAEDTATEEETDESDIVRRKVLAVSAMNEDEAIEQMELLGHSFFLYFNPDTNAINVVYKRSQGGYGILEPSVE